MPVILALIRGSFSNPKVVNKSSSDPSLQLTYTSQYDCIEPIQTLIGPLMKEKIRRKALCDSAQALVAQRGHFRHRLEEERLGPRGRGLFDIVFGGVVWLGCFSGFRV